MKCLRKERDALLKEKEDWKREKTTPFELLDKNGKEIYDAVTSGLLPYFFISQVNAILTGSLVREW